MALASAEFLLVHLILVWVLVFDQDTVPARVMTSPLAEVEPIPHPVGEGQPNRAAQISAFR
jgi:hypothetical protein